MVERILQKLNVLDKKAKILLNRRAKKNRLQYEGREKTLVVPLTFDFHSEFDEASATSTFTGVSKIVEDKSSDIKNSKKSLSFKCEPECRNSDFEKSNLRPQFVPTNIKNQESKSKEPVQENLKSRSIRSLHYLKDTSEAENAEPSHDLYLQTRQRCRRSLSSSVFSPKFSNQSNACTKGRDSTFTAQIEKTPRKSLELIGYLQDDVRRRKCPQMNDFSTKEKKSIRINKPTEHRSVRKKNLLPLCFEDELKNPKAKIINVSPAKTETCHTVEQKDTNPIIFHDRRHIQMLLLTKNGLSPHLLENEKIDPCERTNFVLGRNRAVLKSLIGDQLITLSKPKRTMHTAWGKDKRAITWEANQRTAKEQKGSGSDQPPEDRRRSTSCTFPLDFSDFTPKVVGYPDKTGIQKKSGKTCKFEKMFSTVRPLHTQKISASHSKCYSKTLKNTLNVHKLSDVTPLDDLLNP